MGSSGVTSQVLDEVIQFHLAFSLDAGTVHVSIEEDDGKSKDEILAIRDGAERRQAIKDNPELFPELNINSD